jgi:hypothetical protein
MSTALRPLSTGEVLDRTFVLYRKHFFLFTGIATVQVAFFIAGIVVLVLFGKFMPSETAQAVGWQLLSFSFLS